MPTQEERLTTLEQTSTSFQREAAKRIRETNENSTILLGLVQTQGIEIKRISTRLDGVEQHLETMDLRLGTIDQQLGTMDKRLGTLEQDMSEVKSLLVQIIERLPKP